MNCLHCGATISNGLGLCDLCQRKAATDLEFLPIYFRNLARWRPPARPNGSLGTSGTWMLRRGGSENNQIGNALERSANDLSTWARALSDDRDAELPESDTEAETVAVVAAWLAARITSSIATLPWAGEFVRDIDRHELALRRLTEASIPGWYAGACSRRLTMDDLCGTATYVVPGLTWVTCGACGSTTYARDHLETVITEARDWVDRPKLIAEALVALLDGEQSVDRLYGRIRKWDSLGWIVATRKLDAEGDPTGPKRYRMGDVIDLINGEAGRVAGHPA